ncbi:MAG: HAD-IIIA family hydrolase [Bacilli bacterium]|nr:HAD-IIIA family hydrolase [Bacilli bacterium]
MKALIQAGGAGTRLRSITGDNLPKPMVPINGKPILQYQIENLLENGVAEITIVISKNGQPIVDYFGDGSKFRAKIDYIEENEPLGTAGALGYFAKKCHEDFLLLFGDLMVDIDWHRFINYHNEKKSGLTAFVHPNAHPFDSDLLVADPTGKILKIDSKNNVRDYFYKNVTNAGLYVVGEEVLDYIGEPHKSDFEKEVLKHFIEIGKAYAYSSSEYVKDCGTPDRYESVGKDEREGTVKAKNLSHKQKAIFLDRDGTINVFNEFVNNPDKFVLQEDAAEAIKLINASSYLAICVTNQPVIARGEASFETVGEIHDKMETLLGKGGSYLNGIYFCPHHPDKGFPGERPELKFDCDCRKPKIGMLLQAAREHNIDLSSSWMVGDTKMDVQTGINAGCKTILLTCGDHRPLPKYDNAQPTLTCSSLLEAIKTILEIERK